MIVLANLAVLAPARETITLDGHVVAPDAKIGTVVWDTEAADYRKGSSFTLASLVVKDKAIVGISGGEFGVLGFVEAYWESTQRLGGKDCP